MLVRVEAARSATLRAAWMLAEREPRAHAAACMAKSYCSEACPAVAGDGIQIHGGLGFTWEQDLHLHYKRAKTDALLLGNAEWCREEIARSLLD
jgi:alkylation response protein AidB-like acyl-CoA dehydrogenase